MGMFAVIALYVYVGYILTGLLIEAYERYQIKQELKALRKERIQRKNAQIWESLWAPPTTTKKGPQGAAHVQPEPRSDARNARINA